MLLTPCEQFCNDDTHDPMTLGNVVLSFRPFQWYRPRVVSESLLSMPFAQYLANPCGIGPKLINTTDGWIGLMEPPNVKSNRFVSAFASRYAHFALPITTNNQNEHNQNIELLIRELQLVFLEARHFISQIRTVTVCFWSSLWMKNPQLRYFCVLWKLFEFVFFISEVFIGLHWRWTLVTSNSVIVRKMDLARKIKVFVGFCWFLFRFVCFFFNECFGSCELNV